MPPGNCKPNVVLPSKNAEYTKCTGFSLEDEEVIVLIQKDGDIIEVGFQKKEDALYVSKGADIYLKLIGAEVDDWYDYCFAFEDEREQNSCGVKSINSEFLVDISETCSCVYYKSNQITSSFRLISFYSENDEIYLRCKIKDVKELMKGKELKFVNNIFFF